MDRRSLLVGLATFFAGCSSIRDVEEQAVSPTEVRTPTSTPTSTPASTTSTPEPTPEPRSDPALAQLRIETARRRLKEATSAFVTAFNRIEFGSNSPQFDRTAVTAPVVGAQESLKVADELASPEQESTLAAVTSYAEVLERAVGATDSLVTSLDVRPPPIAYRDDFDGAAADFRGARSALERATSRFERTRVEYRTTRQRLENPDSVGLVEMAEVMDRFDTVRADLEALFGADSELKRGWEDYRTGREDSGNLAASAFYKAISHFGRANYMYDRQASSVPGWVSELDRTVELTGNGSTTGKYTFTVDGRLRGTSIDSDDSIGRNTATGTVGEGSDKYAFSGVITNAEVPEGVTMYVDGQEVTPAMLGGGNPSELTNTIVIAGTGSRADYEFTVTGPLEKNATKASVQEGDVIDGKTATGAVGGGRDAYDYAGVISDFTLSGDAEVLINGETVDPRSLAPAPELDPSVAFDRRFNVYACQSRKFRKAAERMRRAALVDDASPDKADRYREEARTLLAGAVGGCSG